MKSSVLYILFLLVLSIDASGQTTSDIESQARSGNAFSQFTLGEDYCLGNNGKMKDETKALKWLNLSLKNGLDPQYKGKAYRYIAFCYGRREKYHQSMEWLKKAVALNDAEAQLEMGWFYQNGFDVAQDMVQALSWYRKAAEQGLAQAQHNLGVCYYDGKGVGADYYQAVFWYRKAARQGHAVAQNNLGLCYYRGHGVEKDDAKAKYWWKLSDEQGNSIARGNLKLVANVSLPISNPDIDDSANILVAGNNPIEDKKEDNAIQPSAGNNNNLYAQNVQTQPVQTVPQQTTKQPSSDVDVNIPQVSDVQKNTFAIIIANEDYQGEVKVDYAMNDGEVFRDYCHKILGLPEMNIHFVPNATLNNLIGELDWLQQLCEKYKGDASIIFYYVGHGVPDEASGSAYLLPTDGRSRMLRTCFSINELYETLGKLLAKQVTVLMDACFSGSQRNGGMLVSARGVAIKAKTSVPQGNMIVLSAAQGDETAYKYDETGHGLFTYFLLKKLKDTKGNVTMGELSSYLLDQVGRYSIVVNSKSQTPSITASPALQNTWRNLKLK